MRTGSALSNNRYFSYGLRHPLLYIIGQLRVTSCLAFLKTFLFLRLFHAGAQVLGFELPFPFNHFDLYII